jgi:cytochrome P450
MKPRGLDKLFANMTPPQIQFFMDFVAQSLSDRLEKEKANENNPDYVPDREDMLYYLINAKDGDSNKPAYNEIDLTEEANMLTVAGADTTSAVMAALFFYLINDERVLEKLTTEIRTTFANLEEIRTGKQLTSCTYLHAAIDETLRMNPHGGSESRRQVRPGGLRIKQDLIPAGTIIGGDVFAIHHDERIFPEPFRFKPERWIVSNEVTREQVKAREQAIFAFSYGQRGCPGKSLAKMELAVTMARLIWGYDFRGMPGGTEGQGSPDMMWGRQDKTQFQVWDFMVAHRNGPMVQFKKRPVGFIAP